MKKFYKYFFVVILTFVMFNPAFASHIEDHHEKSNLTLDPFIQLMLDQTAFMEGRITSLADAIPEDKYSWRPAEGVRSTGEVIAHIISASYFIPSMMGGEKPTLRSFNMARFFFLLTFRGGHKTGERI